VAKIRKPQTNENYKYNSYIRSGIRTPIPPIPPVMHGSKSEDKTATMAPLSTGIASAIGTGDKN
jgi:hypothetical protein